MTKSCFGGVICRYIYGNYKLLRAFLKLAQPTQPREVTMIYNSYYHCRNSYFKISCLHYPPAIFSLLVALLWQSLTTIMLLEQPHF